MKKFLLLFFSFAIVFDSFGQSNLLWGNANVVSGYDQEALTTDPSGNVIYTGSFRGTQDFDPGPGVTNITSASGVFSPYVFKLDAAGNFLWAKGFGTANISVGESVATDASGNIYVCGYWDLDVDLDPGPATYTFSSPYGANLFVVKLDPTGNFVWGKTVIAPCGGHHSIKVDGSNNVIITGPFTSTADFDPGPGTFSMTAAQTDVYVLKLNSAGNFLWAKHVGGWYVDYPYNLAIDPSGNITVAGNFEDLADFDPGPGTYTLACQTYQDRGFILKLNSSGNFVWANGPEGTGNSYYYGVASDGAGNVFTIGNFRDTLDFNSGAGVYTLISDYGSQQLDIFISKHSSSGVWQWTKQFFNRSADFAIDICVDPSGDIYTTGWFYDTLYCGGGYTLTPVGSSDRTVLAKIDQNGNIVWAGKIGDGPSTFGSARSTSIGSDLWGNILLAGTFNQAVDIDPGPLTYTVSTSSPGGFFHAKFSSIVGIEENSIEKENRILYPNPTSSSFNLTLNSPSQIIITNILGQEILNEKLDLGKQSIDISDQNPGIYFVKVIAEGKQEVVKLIKE